MFWLAAPCIVAGAAVLGVPEEACCWWTASPCSELLVLWPYHRVPRVDRLVRGLVAPRARVRGPRAPPRPAAASAPSPSAERSFLEWLAPRLLEAGYGVGEPCGEDWGWALDVARGERRSLLGASASLGEEEGGGQDGAADWLVQVVLMRSTGGWWRGEQLPRDDALVELVVQSAEGAGFDDLAVHPG